MAKTQKTEKKIRQEERRRIMRLLVQFSDVEQDDTVSEVISDLYKFISEGKREYIKNVYGGSSPRVEE